MNSNSFHDFINFNIVYYFFELTRRITTINNKVYVINFNHFIKLFFYPIQNRDNFFFFRIASFCEHFINKCIFRINLMKLNSKKLEKKKFDLQKKSFYQ